jgi:Protein of unknown function (DUF1064)
MSKYKAVKTTINGIKFDSKAEARRYSELKLLEREGQISGLELQPSFIIAPSVKFAASKRAKPALKYIADFAYTDFQGNKIIEDVKGMLTPAFKIKQHLMMSVLGIDVKVTK